jgi:hypothetical protein
MVKNLDKYAAKLTIWNNYINLVCPKLALKIIIRIGFSGVFIHHML